MNEDRNSPQDVRNSILADISNVDVSVSDIEDTLKSESSRICDLYQSHNDAVEDILEREIEWNPRYFHAHLEVARRGHFSEKRVRHLLAVRRYLSDKSYKGFAVPNGATFLKSNIASPVLQRNAVSGAGFESPDLMISSVNDAGTDRSGDGDVDIPPHIADAIGDANVVRVALEHLFYDNSISDVDLRKVYIWSKDNVENLLEEYEENVFSKAINKDAEKWDYDYFLYQRGYLEANFCEKRFFHLIEVRAYLRDVINAPELQRVARRSLEGKVALRDQSSVKAVDQEKGVLDVVFDIAEWGIGKFFDLVDYLRSKMR